MHIRAEYKVESGKDLFCSVLLIEERTTAWSDSIKYRRA